MGECPSHIFGCPAFVRGGWCPVGLRCVSDMCFEYHYKTLAVLQHLPIGNSTSFISKGSYDCLIPVTMIAMQTSNPPSSLSTDRASPTHASQNGQPKNLSQTSQALPISDKVIGISTAWKAKIGKIAAKSQADEDWDTKSGNRRLRRLGCVVMGFLVITVVMFVF